MISPYPPDMPRRSLICRTLHLNHTHIREINMSTLIPPGLTGQEPGLAYAIDNWVSYRYLTCTHSY
jgi:hypothetical protein